MRSNSWRGALAIAGLTELALALLPDHAAAEFSVSVHVRAQAETSAGIGGGTIQDNDEHDSGILSGISTVTQSARASVGGDLGAASSNISVTATLGHVTGSATASAAAFGPFDDVRELYVGGEADANSLDVPWKDSLTIGSAAGTPVDFTATLHLDSTVSCFGSAVVGGCNGRVNGMINLANFNLFVSDLLNGPDSLDACVSIICTVATRSR